ncbi:MAG TPA: hypothetical protein VEB59_00890 [Gemmatimonadales bacterium]|nr:hypothetical protein [Gemmatimonadales bacterium]
MNKLAIGCVGVLAVGVAGAAGASYYAYHKVTSAVAPVVQLGSLGEIERPVRRPYAPPASGEPSGTQVGRVLEVQRAVRARIGARADEVYHRYRKYFEPENGVKAPVGGVVDSAALGLRMSLELAGIYMEGKRAQVEALERAGMSLEEYGWTRSQMYAALGVPYMEIDVAGIVAGAQSGRPPAPKAGLNQDTTGSPAVRRLVEPHRKMLEENVGLAFFGL